MLSRGSLQRSTFSGVWEHFPHSARSTGRSVFNIIIASSSSSILSSSSSSINNNPTNHCDPQVPQLVKMIGPDPSKFSGLSTRVDEQLGRHHHHQCPQIHVQLLLHDPTIVMFIVQLLWRLGWRTSRCSDTSSPISLTSGLSHRW